MYFVLHFILTSITTDFWRTFLLRCTILPQENDEVTTNASDVTPQNFAFIPRDTKQNWETNLEGRRLV